MKFAYLLISLLSFSHITTAASAAAAESENSTISAEETVDLLLSAVGGRDGWAALTGTVNDSQQNLVEDPTVLRVVITMDFEQPRFRVDTTGEGLNVSRVIDGDNSWRTRLDGTVEDVSADLYESDMQWYGAHVYRSIHRIARRDPALTYRLGEDGRLEVFENERQMLWFKLDARGEPYAFGAWDNDIGTLSGPWDYSEDGIKHPIWVSNATGTWRANIKALELNPKIKKSDLKRP